ncbi:rCG40754 [Rattus norvegicus]|uniref:RCG40754 n=1 Tax=Rattus norvegicus TaxID=10116 RepID=A6KP18_RAT|nr:rCG40754 [Rattus norvegicus]
MQKGCKTGTRLLELLWSLTAAKCCPGSGGAGKPRHGACWCRCRCLRPLPPEGYGLSSPTPCWGSNRAPFGEGGL